MHILYIYCHMHIMHGTHSRGTCRSELSNLNKETGGSIFHIQVSIDTLGYGLSTSENLNLLSALLLLNVFLFFFTLNKRKAVGDS